MVAGGISRGQWITSFNLNLVTSDALSSELRNIAEGMKLAWDKGFRRVILETDSKRALDLINSGGTKGNLLEHLVKVIVSLRSRNWDISLKWCFRECNGTAHWLAGDALGKSSGLSLLMEPPLSLKPILMRDLGLGNKRRWVSSGF